MEPDLAKDARKRYGRGDVEENSAHRLELLVFCLFWRARKAGPRIRGRKARYVKKQSPADPNDGSIRRFNFSFYIINSFSWFGP